jgi:hypothetical protein
MYVVRRTGTVLISPVPRYIYSKCCNDASHIENFEDTELDEEIVAGLEGIRNNAKLGSGKGPLFLNNRSHDSGRALLFLPEIASYEHGATAVGPHCSGPPDSRWPPQPGCCYW